ncbi:transposase [Sphingosinicella rhizophila]|uniref:Transposase n=1 Tax=Sphingosinicella rhizophila TaxID=3050082 RepID=A0ABU3QBC2_9SPHN|nr:transposase [Sphingosinicella sp. GR2756]MDT9600695.1 transposase [Sphingosinicella sp. GR2756]
MARIARIVVPNVPHHVTQRGNRRQDVFFGEEDYAAYKGLVAEACAREGVRCLAWCLMPNHVHLILVPPAPDALRGALAEAHRRYARRINLANDWTGYLFQGRFASYPMDDAHLMIAIRYVELNPVRAGLTKSAEAWPWSSARAHVGGKPDGLTDLAALAGVHRNWRTMLRQGLEAGDVPDEAAAAIELHQRTGRPWGDAAFLAGLEGETGRALGPGRRGRPRRENN